MKTPQWAIPTVARTIPHPWKNGETRNVYEFPVTRKIIIEADPDIPISEILAMAKRCHDKELGVGIISHGCTMSLAPPERSCASRDKTKNP
jgi:hypothetical protein